MLFLEEAIYFPFSGTVGIVELFFKQPVKGIFDSGIVYS